MSKLSRNLSNLPAPLSRGKGLSMPALLSRVASPSRAASGTPALKRPESARVVNVMLALDCSPSMGDHGKMKEANQAASACFAELAASPVVHRFRVGVLVFDDKARVIEPLAAMRGGQSGVVNGRSGGEGTNIGGAIELGARELIEQSSRDQAAGLKPVNVQIIVSDGESTTGPDPETAAARAKAQGITIVTVGIGAGAHQRELQSIASSPTHAYAVYDGAALQQLLQRFGWTLSQASIQGGGIGAALGSI